MLTLLKLVLVVVFVFSAVAAFHSWLDHIERRRIVVTWSRFFLWLWMLATAAWLGPMVFLGLVRGDFFRTPLLSLEVVALYGALPSLVALGVGILVAFTHRSFRSRATEPKL